MGEGKRGGAGCARQRLMANNQSETEFLSVENGESVFLKACLSFCFQTVFWPVRDLPHCFRASVC